MDGYGHDTTGYVSRGRVYDCVGDAMHDLIISKFLALNTIDPTEIVRFALVKHIPSYRYFAMRGLDSSVLDVARTFAGIESINVLAANMIVHLGTLVALALDSVVILSGDGRGVRVGYAYGDGLDSNVIVRKVSSVSSVFTDDVYSPSTIRTISSSSGVDRIPLEAMDIMNIFTTDTDYGDAVRQAYARISPNISSF